MMPLKLCTRYIPLYITILVSFVLIFSYFQVTQEVYFKSERYLFNRSSSLSSPHEGQGHLSSGRNIGTVFCMVLTIPKYLPSRGKAVLETWGKRCDKFVFASDVYDPKYPTLNFTNVPAGYKYLREKVVAGFNLIWKEHSEYDWFLKADDDTYVIMENLKYLLSKHDPNKKLYLGQLYNYYSEAGYHSGGAGYVISREALKSFISGHESKCNSTGYYEDLWFGTCMQKLGIPATDALDEKGKPMFNGISLMQYITGKTLFIQDYAAHPAKNVDGLSDRTISLHYVGNESMYLLDTLLYKIRPHGID